MLRSHIHLFSKRWITKNSALIISASVFLSSLTLVPCYAEVTDDDPVNSLAQKLEVTGACSANERWTFDAEFKRGVAASMIDEFRNFLKGKTSSVRGFSEALALRGLGTTDQAKIFSEYWISRALIEGGLSEIGVNGLNALVAREVTQERLPIQLAALRCIEKMHYQHRALFFSDAAIQRLPSYFQFKVTSYDSSVTLWDAATRLALHLLEKEANPAAIQETLKYLTNSGAHKTFVESLIAIRTGHYPEAAEKIKAILNRRTLPVLIDQERDHLKVILARLDYSDGSFTKSVDLFRRVSKRSNELTSALSGLSWAYLQSGGYAEAIGLGISVQSGWMKETFIPEPLLVAAMALNEVCRYPESIRLVQILKREYKDVFQWLKHYNESPDAEKPNLYPLAIRYLKSDGKPRRQKDVESATPIRIASEWIRSPVFLAYQDGINVLFAQKKSITKLESLGQKEEYNQAVQLLKRARHLRKAYHDVRIETQTGARLPASIISEFRELRNQVTHFRRLERAAGIWDNILASANPRNELTQKDWIHQIEVDLAKRNREMYEDLGDVAENTDLIEVEINNGASDDIIRQNAQGEIGTRKGTKKVKSRDVARSSGDVYQWGASISTLTGNGEIWEDELDSLKANLTDQCAVDTRSSKKKE